MKKTLIEQAAFFGGIVLIGLVIGNYHKGIELFETEAQRKAHTTPTAEQLEEMNRLCRNSPSFYESEASLQARIDLERSYAESMGWLEK